MNIDNALLSLDGLSVGDAFGETFFGIDAVNRINLRQLPDGVWKWTDDTHMTLSVIEILNLYGKIEQEQLMKHFSNRLIKDGRLGYGAGARQLLERVYNGENWQEINKQIFKGGSYGNGAAMRVAPIGGFFSCDPERTVSEARLSAEVTHAHPEGIAGAIAIAVAASISSQPQTPNGSEFIKTVLDYVPDGLTKTGILRSLDISPTTSIDEVVHIIGNGSDVSAQDTVPFCLWCAAYHLDNFEEALWTTVSGLGDRDTNCAMVGGIVALSAKKVPEKWLKHREPLPIDFLKLKL